MQRVQAPIVSDISQPFSKSLQYSLPFWSGAHPALLRYLLRGSLGLLRSHELRGDSLVFRFNTLCIVCDHLAARAACHIQIVAAQVRDDDILSAHNYGAAERIISQIVRVNDCRHAW